MHRRGGHIHFFWQQHKKRTNIRATNSRSNNECKCGSNRISSDIQLKGCLSGQHMRALLSVSCCLASLLLAGICEQLIVYWLQISSDSPTLWMSTIEYQLRNRRFHQKWILWARAKEKWKEILAKLLKSIIQMSLSCWVVINVTKSSSWTPGEPTKMHFTSCI